MHAWASRMQAVLGHDGTWPIITDTMFFALYCLFINVRPGYVRCHILNLLQYTLRSSTVHTHNGVRPCLRACRPACL